MSRRLVELTTEYQLVMNAGGMLTVQSQGQGTLFVTEEDQDDELALRVVSGGEAGQQIRQSDPKPVYARATHPGWKVIINE
ncbi:hypothetical protein KAR91_33330 [Candidatus Pacearchaeota archaeon]|nr:hypothetical protein [Candidatus Pacearchaeota archaeon]